MPSQNSLLCTDADTLHHLPLSPLEDALKKVYLLRQDIHNRILSAAEVLDYYSWMANNFDGPADTQESILTDGAVGQIGQHLLQNPKDLAALSHLTALYEASPESGTFAEDQDITICRPLRYMPPYWHTSDYFEIYYVFSGTCPVYFEKETLVLIPGDVIIIPPYPVY